MENKNTVIPEIHIIDRPAYWCKMVPGCIETNFTNIPY